MIVEEKEERREGVKKIKEMGVKRRLYEGFRKSEEEMQKEIERRMPMGYKKVAVEMDEKGDVGLVSRKEIKEGEVVAYLTRGASVQLSKENLFMENDYRLQLGELLFCPKPEEREIAGLANDALDDEGNNCKWKVIEGKPALVAAVNIEEGERIGVAYGWAYWARKMEYGEEDIKEVTRMKVVEYYPECRERGRRERLEEMEGVVNADYMNSIMQGGKGGEYIAAVTMRVSPLLIEVEVQGKQMKALVDSGACETCMREEVAKELGWMEEAVESRRGERWLRNADGSRCKDQGKEVVGERQIIVTEEKGERIVLKLQQVTIMRQLCTELILSLAFCAANKWVIHTGEAKITMEGGNKVIRATRRREVKEGEMAPILRAEDENGLVVMAEDTLLEARCNTLIDVVAKENISGGPFMFCPCLKLQWEGISVSEGIYEGRTMKMLVTNEGANDIIIPAGTPLGCTELLYISAVPNPGMGQWGSAIAAIQEKEQGEEQIELPRLDSSIPEGAKGEFEQMLQGFKEVFKNDFSEEPWRTTPFKIELVPEAQPAKFRHYRFNEDHKAKLRILLAKYIAENVIEESSSPWASPAFFVPKPDGGLRFVVDFRHLNKYTKDARWPLPLIEDVLDELRGSCVFSKFDAHSGFFQMPIDEYSRELTAFITPLGLYQFTRLPMGARNGASMFSRAMAEMVKDLKGIALYLDDTNVHSGKEDKEETALETYRRHMVRVKEFLQRCRERNLKLNGKKCLIGCKETKFLGHIVSEKGIGPDPEKVKKVQDMLPPRDVGQLRTFLGLVNYYRNWIRNCAARQRHMSRLLGKEVEFKFDEKCMEEFEDMKRVLTSEPVVRHYPDPGREYILFTDASDYTIGAVLAQKDEEGKEQVIAYYSRLLTMAERKYATYEKECLGMVESVQRFKVYLHKHFKIFTDHHSLRSIMSWKNPKPRIQRWLEILSMYSFTAYYRAGCQNLNADALSRVFASHIPPEYKTGSIRITADDGNGQIIPPEIREMSDDLEFMEMGVNSKMRKREKDTVIAAMTRIVEAEEEDINKFNAKEVMEKFQEESGEDDWEVFRDFEELIGKEIRDVETREIYIVNDIRFDSEEAVFKAKVNPHRDEELQQNEQLERLSRWINLDTVDLWMEQEKLGYTEDVFTGFDETFREKVIEEIERLIRNKKIRREEITRIRTAGGAEHFYRIQIEKVTGVQYYQLIIPYEDEILIQSMIRAAHIAVGHAAAERTLAYLSTRIFFARMRKKVGEYCEACEVCQERGKGSATNNNPYQTLAFPEVTRPHERISIDLMGPIKKSRKGNQYIIFAVDNFSKWVYGKAIPNKEAVTIAQFLVEEIFWKVGCPEVIRADGGKEFDNNLNKEIARLMRISWSQSTPYHPQANGQVERFNQTGQNMISKMIQEQDHQDWDDYIGVTTHAYNTSVNTVTGLTPFILHHGRECREWIDRILPDRLPESLQGVNNDKYAEYYYTVMWRMQHLYKQCASKLEKRHSMYMRPRTISEVKYGFKKAEYTIGERVYIHIPMIAESKREKTYHKFLRYWRGPYTITKKINDVVYEVKKRNRGKAIKQHISHIKPYIENEYQEYLFDI